MSKPATIASLLRVASKGEPTFIETAQGVINDEPLDRVAEFFDRMNLPRSTGIEEPHAPIPMLTVTPDRIGTFEEEALISAGLQKLLDRHERKIKWHAGHPSAEGIENVLLVMRVGIVGTAHRLDRLLLVMKSKDELTPREWAIAREVMNKTYLSFRNFLNLLAGPWIDAVTMSVAHDELAEKLGNFYELVDEHVRRLENYRQRIEERRLEITVLPEGFPPVKPPNYFGGDLLSRGPWRQFWANIDQRAHHFRESAG